MCRSVVRVRAGEGATLMLLLLRAWPSWWGVFPFLRVKGGLVGGEPVLAKDRGVSVVGSAGWCWVRGLRRLITRPKILGHQVDPSASDFQSKSLWKSLRVRAYAFYLLDSEREIRYDGRCPRPTPFTTSTSKLHLFLFSTVYVFLLFLQISHRNTTNNGRRNRSSVNPNGPNSTHIFSLSL